MRTTVSRWLAIAAVILLSLALALPLFMGTSQEAFASTQVHTFSSTPLATQEHWVGTGRESNGKVFSMDVEVLIQGCGCFTGTLYEYTYHTEVDIQGHSAKTGGIGFGTFRFTSTHFVFGNDLCLGCYYWANYDNRFQTRMSGVWYYPDGTRGGPYILYLDEP